jgi:hypothetical protein
MKSLIYSCTLVVLISAGCGKTSQSQPPAPPLSGKLDPALESELPRTPDGKPVHYAVNGQNVGPRMLLVLAYDEKLDDPTARWGECLSRVVACYKTNEGPIAACVKSIERCSDDAGGKQCCPRACLDQFNALVASGKDEDTALRSSIVAGGCVKGFAEQPVFDGGAS